MDTIFLGEYASSKLMTPLLHISSSQGLVHWSMDGCNNASHIHAHAAVRNALGVSFLANADANCDLMKCPMQGLML